MVPAWRKCNKRRERPQTHALLGGGISSGEQQTDRKEARRKSHAVGPIPDLQVSSALPICAFKQWRWNKLETREAPWPML